MSWRGQVCSDRKGKWTLIGKRKERAMRRLILLMALCAGAILSGACGGEAALGEECGEEGADGECEGGAVCGKPDDSDALECLKVCNDQDDCPADQECNGISGSDVKGCRPK